MTLRGIVVSVLALPIGEAMNMFLEMQMSATDHNCLDWLGPDPADKATSCGVDETIAKDFPKGKGCTDTTRIAETSDLLVGLAATVLPDLGCKDVCCAQDNKIGLTCPEAFEISLTTQAANDGAEVTTAISTGICGNKSRQGFTVKEMAGKQGQIPECTTDPIGIEILGFLGGHRNPLAVCQDACCKTPYDDMTPFVKREASHDLGSVQMWIDAMTSINKDASAQSGKCYAELTNGAGPQVADQVARLMQVCRTSTDFIGNMLRPAKVQVVTGSSASGFEADGKADIPYGLDNIAQCLLQKFEAAKPEECVKHCCGVDSAGTKVKLDAVAHFAQRIFLHLPGETSRLVVKFDTPTELENVPLAKGQIESSTVGAIGLLARSSPTDSSGTELGTETKYVQWHDFGFDGCAITGLTDVPTNPPTFMTEAHQVTIAVYSSKKEINVDNVARLFLGNERVYTYTAKAAALTELLPADDVAGAEPQNVALCYSTKPPSDSTTPGSLGNFQQTLLRFAKEKLKDVKDAKILPTLTAMTEDLTNWSKNKSMEQLVTFTPGSK